ncbi:hypothetical protein Ari01nite_96360 [Paractinoplanes rishiriensis]|uniref:Uncharacterized protein n=1 Tax=Paractinoplanes rishiriensis TaxID=1050105 RepID=A0A919MW70_9ACTN|nr:hypothetical protein Ari01nite_96360 [Actinoplanes rishiriensis]
MSSGSRPGNRAGGGCGTHDPTRPEAAAAEIEQVGPDTVVWLNEAQLYLSPTDARLGERIAAGCVPCCIIRTGDRC